MSLGTYETEAVAWEAVVVYHADSARGTYIDRAKADTPLRVVYARYMASRSWGKESTRLDWLRFGRGCITGEASTSTDRLILGDFPVSAVTLDAARRWVKSLTREGLSPNTVNKWWIRLRALLDYAQQHGHILSNPLDGHDPLTRGTTAAHKRTYGRHLLTLEEAVTLTLATRPPYALPVEVVLWGGMRQGEVRGLAGGSILGARGIVSVDGSVASIPGAPPVRVDTKTASSFRQPPLPSPILAALVERAADVGPGDPIFPAVHKGGWMHGGLLNDAWTDAVAAAGLLGTPGDPIAGRRRKPVPHDARGSVASWLLACGIPVSEVQVFLGHGSAQLTLDVYTEVQRWDVGAGDPIVDDVKAAGLGLRGTLDALYRGAWERHGGVTW